MLKKESTVEKLSGNSALNLASSVFSAYIGSPLVALLPPLLSIPAATRHKKRIEDAVKDINKSLEKMGNELNKVSDQQYKLINETFLTILRTTNDEKIKYLKKVITNGVNSSNLDDNCVTALSRVLRDISVEELLFLIKIKDYNKIYIDHQSEETDSLSISKNTKEFIFLTGLQSLGLLTFNSQHAGVDVYYISELTFLLLGLLGD